ncbi:hypothetical protein IYR97_13640 [Pseudomonas fulva]|uniref:Uncharacterized protein n=1 Tax=Pseudomonas fulva TaxID=47880 RepID=A0A7S9L4K6_9PSED|nr:hypothetical protein [Pseudomonas fulva]QPH42373.1 hypothetical protein IYR97_13640 [Pseudomonas fulva]QPH47437.1 hypothetical protein IZU98_13535 [Pseudomonas fulva]
MTNIDTIRAEFERTNARDHRREPPKGNNYTDPLVQADWESFQKGWEASRNSMCVKNPFELIIGDPDGQWAHEVAEKSLRAQGFTVVG